MHHECSTRIAVTIVVPVRSDIRLSRLLESLANQTTPRELYEVIVIENGSSMAMEIAIRFGARYLHLANPNTYAARNVGIRESNGEYVLSIDSDCIATPQWSQAYLDGFRSSPELAALGGPIERFDPQTPAQRFGTNLVEGQRHLNYLMSIMPLPYVVTANCAYRKSAITQVGGFDEELLSGGDVDICYKLGLAGYRLGICSEAVVYHDNRRTVRSHFRRFFQYARYQTLLFKKYRHATHPLLTVNPYPCQCICKGTCRMARGILATSNARSALVWEGWLLVVEGVAVLLGDAAGAWEHRVPYI